MMDDVVSLIEALAWPVAVLIIAIAFRQQIGGLFGKIETLEVPGAKAVFNRQAVEQIIERGKQEGASADKMADQIIKSATIVDTLELRILRALFDEPDGRLIENYQRYYRDALQSLIGKGYVGQSGGKFYLTPKGTTETRDYLRNVMARLEQETSSRT